MNASDLASLGQLNASLGSAINTISTAKTTRKDRDFMREMWDRQKTEWYYQTDYANALQKALIADQRDYDEKQWDEKNSPEAIVRNLEAAGINAAQFFSGGSSSIQPFTGDSAASPSLPGSGHSLPGYSPRYLLDPLSMAQVADLSASAELKRSQADLTEHESVYKDSLTALNGSKQVLANLQAEGVPFANRMAEVNARIAEALEGTNVTLGEAGLSKMVMQTDLFRRQIRDLDDKHDLHGMRKQELKNQLDIQVASEAVLWAREAAARKGLQLTDGQIALIHEQALKVASETDLNEQDSDLKQFLLDVENDRSPNWRRFDDLNGVVGSSLKAAARFLEFFETWGRNLSRGHGIPQK